METRFGDVAVTYSARGIPTYSIEAFHDGLCKHALIKAPDKSVLLNKAKAIEQQWNGLWEKQVETESRIRCTREGKEARRLRLENQKERALERTTEAQQTLTALRTALTNGLERDPTIDWVELSPKDRFAKPWPHSPGLPPPPVAAAPPRQPDPADPAYVPQITFLDRLIPSRKANKLADMASRFDADFRRWQTACAELDSQHQAAVEAHRKTCDHMQAEYAATFSEWEEEKRRHTEQRRKRAAEVEEIRVRYESQVPEAIIDYCERVLSNSDYPSCIPREFDFEFAAETGFLLINSRLPAPDDLPKLTEVKYVQTTDSFKEIFLSEIQSAKLYDDLIYQIALRTLHELFQSDAVKAISAIVFNGIVTSTDKSTGNEVTACILSLQATKEAFLAINLAKVDPKACFRQLRGVGSSKLHSVTPVAPIVQLSREDHRFVQSYAVADQLNSGYNLATMDWEDFEHLIREIFEKEFSASGGEVKVTQASRDGGVDAVAFDPDPIRGGKIVIQAKRYAYTVGVSAVRDLYGTVMNEGASKGILVTTSDYGPDAYEFASGKPLTLLSGSNLLHLLAKHGVGAHINLNEARKIAQERASKAGGETM